MTEVDAFEALAASLVGKPISHLWRGHGSAVFIEIGQLTSRARRSGTTHRSWVQLEGEISVGVQWSWRIQDACSVLCGSWSEEELWEPAFDRLRGSFVQDCRLFGSIPEIELVTDKDLGFLSFTTTEGQPQWHVVDRQAGPARWFSTRKGRLHISDGREPAFG